MHRSVPEAFSGRGTERLRRKARGALWGPYGRVLAPDADPSPGGGGTDNPTALSIQNGGTESVIVRDFSVHGGTKNNSVSGVCPLFLARDNSKFFDLELSCTNPGEPAIEIKGKNVVIQNVIVPRYQFLVRAIDDYHIDVGTLSVSGSTGTAVFANIGTGSVTVECTDDNRYDSLVVIQRANNFVDPGSCPVVSLDTILNPLGTQYEIDYINRNAEVTPLQEAVRWGLFTLVGLFVALFSTPSSAARSSFARLSPGQSTSGS